MLSCLYVSKKHFHFFMSSANVQEIDRHLQGTDAMKKKPKRPKLGPGRLSADELAKLPDRLLDAALHLFDVQGYANTTMEQIAKQAGASTKTIYSRYPNKAAIL